MIHAIALAFVGPEGEAASAVLPQSIELYHTVESPKYGGLVRKFIDGRFGIDTGSGCRVAGAESRC